MPTADLTVVLANYNHARYLPRSLDAILSQSVRPRELIALDDASIRTDEPAPCEHRCLAVEEHHSFVGKGTAPGIRAVLLREPLLGWSQRLTQRHQKQLRGWDAKVRT